MRAFRLGLLVISFLFAFSSQAAEKSQLVDVNKSSKLSDYFKKMSGKVTNDSEEKALVKTSSKKSSKISLKEDEILLKEATSEAQKSKEVSPFTKMMFAIVGLLFMAGLCLMGVQKMGKKKGYSQIAQNIKILTQKPIGPKKQLMLIRVAGETILLGVTDHNVNHIKTLSLMEDELPSFTEPKFASQLQDKIEKTKEEPSVLEREPEDVDGFAVSSLSAVKDVVSTRFSL